MERKSTRNAVALLAIVAQTAGAAVLGTIPTQRSVRAPWYLALRKPRFQPPAQVFGPVWTALYTLMAASAWRIWRAPDSPARTRALGLWETQLMLNAAWPWVFFGARRPKAAAAELVVLFTAIAAYMNEARKVDALAATLMAPYLAWTGFAGALNEEIARRN